MLVGGYTCYDNYLLFNHAQDKSLLKYKPILFDDGTVSISKEFSDDLVSWITIDDTNIDYPVMQGENNSVYLNIDPYGEYSLSGSIFLDSRNSSDFTDPYSLLYGHHMDNGFMFGALDEFENENYFNSHRTGELLVTSNKETGRLCKLNIFAVFDTVTTEDAFRPTEVEIGYDYIRERAQIYREPTNTNNPILGISTCQSAETTGRLIVFAEIMDTGRTSDINNSDSEISGISDDETVYVTPADIVETNRNSVPVIVYVIIAVLSVILCGMLYYLISYAIAKNHKDEEQERTDT